MGLKVKDKVEAPAPSMETALASMGLGGNPLATQMEAERKEFLPYCKIAWGIEGLTYTQTVGGKEHKFPATGKLVLSQGGTVEPVPVPYLLSVLAGRGGTRELLPNAQGKQSYKRTYAAMKGDPAAEHLAQVARGSEKNSKVQLGNCYLVALLNPAEGTPETCVLALLEAYKTQQGYWASACEAALVSNNNGIRVEIEDHCANETASKANAVNKYYDPRKFNQWKQVTLTAEQKKLIALTVDAKRSAIEAWMAR